MKKLETQYNSLQVMSIITKLGTKEVLNYMSCLLKIALTCLHINN